MTSQVFPKIPNSFRRNNISHRNSKSFLLNDPLDKIINSNYASISKSKDKIFVKMLNNKNNKNKKNIENLNNLNNLTNLNHNRNSISSRIIKFSKKFQILATNFATGINLGKDHCKAEFEFLLKEKSVIIIQKHFRGHRNRKIYKKLIKERLNLFKERRYQEIKNQWIQSHPTFIPKNYCFFNVRISKFIDRINYVLKKKINIYLPNKKKEFIQNLKFIVIDSQVSKISKKNKIPELKKSFKYLSKDQNLYSQRPNTNMLETNRKVLSIKLKLNNVQNETKENKNNTKNKNTNKNAHNNSDNIYSSIIKIKNIQKIQKPQNNNSKNNNYQNENISQFSDANISERTSNDISQLSSKEKITSERNINMKIKILNNKYILKGVNRNKAISERFQKENPSFGLKEK